MNEWDAFGVIAALVAFVITVVAPIVKLNTTIVKLTAVVEKLSSDFSLLVNRNENSHEKMIEQLGDHETRITVLEHGKEQQ